MHEYDKDGRILFSLGAIRRVSLLGRKKSRRRSIESVVQTKHKHRTVYTVARTSANCVPGAALSFVLFFGSSVICKRLFELKYIVVY